MTKLTLVAIILLWLANPVKSQYNTQVAAQSLVKILVEGSNGTFGCSGFLWKQKSWVVTSLHAMQPGATIRVGYPNLAIAGKSIFADAKVSKVFQEGDLVLLEIVDKDKGLIPANVIALPGFASKVAESEEMNALGYLQGGKSYRKIPLKRAGIQSPENLTTSLPEKKVNALTASGTFITPSMTLEVYNMDGNSLQPGFSGCPVYNSKGELIGIGDGGLEEGQKNISWCIPASNLLKLEASTDATIPAGLSKTAMHYSAEVSLPNSEPTATNTGQNQDEVLGDDYKSFNNGQLDFYQTKTRTFDEMQQTSNDPEGMEIFSNILKSMNFSVNYDALNFDIYEDINKGFSIATPAGSKLQYYGAQDGTGEFEADLDGGSFPQSKYFELFYFLDANNGNPVQDAINFFDTVYADAKGIKEQENYRKEVKLNDEWTVVYSALFGNKAYDDKDAGNVELMLYLTTIYSKDEVFYSCATVMMPQDNQELAELNNGVDCVNNPGKCPACCGFVNSFMQAIAAAHMTTLSFIHSKE